MAPKEVGKTVPVAQLAWAIREVETGGMTDAQRYSNVNRKGATGAYQVLTGNIAAWTKQVLGKSLTLDQWLGNKQAQDKVAMAKLGASQKKYGNWQQAAAVWFSGQPYVNSDASDGGNTVPQYIAKVYQNLTTGKTIDGSSAVQVGDDSGGLTDTALGWLSDLVQPIVVVGKGIASVGAFAEFLLKLALPSTWVRIACAIGGALFLLGGMVLLGLEASKGGT
jgi:hypothetical protein